MSAMAIAKQKAYGKIGLYCLCYYTVTSILAVFTGIAVVILIKPGTIPTSVTAPSNGEYDVLRTVDAFLDLIRWL